MFEAREYELLDFGAGRKLERFGQYILDRPAPTADGFNLTRPELWKKASARFEISAGRSSQAGSERGRWTMSGSMPPTWTVRHEKIQFELKLTNFGHVGLFPEQAANWDWINKQIENARQVESDQPLRVLNLFAYTGGSTLAAGTCGAEVTHVDAARTVVGWARRNAELSGLSAAPIRWIVDDAVKFTRRELKRGQRYDAIILDPPSYGHGAGGESWKLDDDLAELLNVCRELTVRPRFVLLTCHAPDYNPRRLAECLVTAGFGKKVEQIEAGDLFYSTTDGRRLHAGAFARTGSISG